MYKWFPLVLSVLALAGIFAILAMPRAIGGGDPATIVEHSHA